MGEDMWRLCGNTIEEGEKRQLFLQVDEEISMPATAVCGAYPGRTVLITAGIHSDEYPGIAGAIRAAARLDPAHVHGRILIVHCVNVAGFWAKTSYVPDDHANLNGNYPGDPLGGHGARIADFFVRTLFGQVDFIMDLHSGGKMEPLTPCLFFPAAAGARVREASLYAAQALDIPYLIASSARTGQYSYAAGMGIPGLLVERGACGLLREQWVTAVYRDILRLLSRLGVCEDIVPGPVCDKKVFERTVYLSAAEDGLWYPAVEENQSVHEGSLLGHAEDFWGNVTRQYFAEAKGRVFYYTASLAVRVGDPLVAYGIEE